MTVELGAFALALALALSLAQTVLGLIGGRRPTLAGAGEGAAIGAFLGVAVAFAALLTAFITSDFSVANVASNSHTAKPLLYKLAGTWGSHEGSMLLWCLILTGYGAAVAGFGKGLPAGLKSRALGVQGLLGVLFLAYTVLASNPLARLASPPIEGRSLNPLLQDPALAFHPPFLYLGYVGFSVVFSFAVAALIEGRVDAAWARWVRPWTLAAWSFLTIGIALGSFWAYYELGWGGWWFWDPVENASFMPWLIGAALLHSAIVTEKRGALSGWTLFLALAAFTFSMLGAFLVRSGVLTSVHAFAVDPTRGVLLLSILGVSSGAAFALFAWRSPALAPGGVFAPASRESLIVLNNILLTAATGAVLFGTLYPLIYEAFAGAPITVGPPYFNLVFGVLMGLAMLILPFGPLTAWKRGNVVDSAAQLRLAGAIAVLVGFLIFALMSPRKALASGGVALGAWVIAGAASEIVQRTRAFKAPWPEVRRRLTGLPRGSWGMTLAHAGLGLFILGACFETSWKVEAAEALSIGGQVRLGAFELTLKSVGTVDGPNYIAERGQLTVTRGGKPVCAPAPERRFYPAGKQSTSEVALCNLGFSQVYTVLGERRAAVGGGPAWLVRAYYNPWVQLIYLGPLLMALGGLLSLSDRRLRFAVGSKP